MKDIESVFFDCWSTVITFEEKNKRWNILPLQAHALNASSVDWDVVFSFSEQFFHDYYASHLDYEITASEFLNLLIYRFNIQTDSSSSFIAEEILSHLDPKPVSGISSFLSFLEEKKIPYAILSNTIYSQESTFALVRRLLPSSHFSFFLASSTIGVKKPNPLFFTTGVSLLKANIVKSLYIGDALYQDAYGSYRSGFGYSVWLNHKNKNKENYRFLIPNLDSVPYVEKKDYPSIQKWIEED